MLILLRGRLVLILLTLMIDLRLLSTGMVVRL